MTECKNSKILKLKGQQNWNVWKFAMNIAFESKGYMDLIDGEEEFPSKYADDDEDETKLKDKDKYAAEVKAFKDKDIKVREFIVERLEMGPVTHILSCKTSYEMWEKLCALYEQKNDMSVSNLYEKFFGLRYENQGIEKYLAELEDVRDKLLQFGEKLSETLYMSKIINGLPMSYNSFKSAWESTPKKRQTMNELTSRLLVEQKRKGEDSGEASGTALYHGKSNSGKSRAGYQNNRSRFSNDTSRFSKDTCNFCKKSGHFVKDCELRKSYEKGACFRCNEKGHRSSECPSKDKVKDNNNEKGKFDKESNNNFKNRKALTTIALINNGDFDLKYWYADSGASQHMTPRENVFQELHELAEPVKIKVGNGSIVYAHAEGRVPVKVYNGKYWYETTMVEVLYVPELSCNLFSTGAVTDKGFEFRMDYGRCWVMDKEEVIAVGERDDGLYKMCFETVLPKIEYSYIGNLVKGVDTVKIWHERLAHQNVKQVKFNLDRYGIRYVEKPSLCEACVLGKHHKMPFYNSDHRASYPGEMVHADVCGPMSVKSYGGARYFLIVKDDFSRYRTIYIIKSKGEVKDKLIEFFSFAEKQTGNVIKVLRTDNGSEFMSKTLEAEIKRRGIIHQKSCTYTPQQNGRVERENRTIVEAARSMLLAKGLEKELWAEAVMAANYVINRTGKSLVKGKSPYEVWFNKVPEIKGFQIFGSVAYRFVPEEKRKKWDAKSEKGIFIGYDEESKGYRIFFKDENRVEISREVIFDPLEQKEIKISEENNEVIIFDEVMPNDDMVINAGVENPEVGRLEENVEEDEDLVDRDGHGNPEMGENNPADRQDRLENLEIENIENGVRDESRDDSFGSESFHSLENDGPQIEGEEFGVVNDNEGKENVLERIHGLRTDEKAVEHGLRTRAQIQIPKTLEGFDLAMAAKATLQNRLTFYEATHGEKKDKYIPAVQRELQSMEENEVWEVVENPGNVKLLDTTWVFTDKEDGNGQIIGKARLVARGFQQDGEFDFGEIYTPVAKLPTVRTMLAVANQFGYQVFQMDVKTAFLYGEIKEDVFLHPPEGYKVGEGKVLKLKKSLYGLKKSPHYWNCKFNEVMIANGYKRSRADYCLYVKINEMKKTYLLLYVDDIIMFGDEVEDIRKRLKSRFQMKDLGKVRKYLGLEIEQDVEKGRTTISQKTYLEKLLKEVKLEDCKPLKIPLDPGFTPPEEPKDEYEKSCRKLIGGLMYAVMGSRPDLAAGVGILSRYQKNGNIKLYNALKQVLRYVKYSLNLKLVFRRVKKTQEIIEGFTDADFAGDKLDRKSTTGYLFKIFGGLVSWSSKKQSRVADSSCEAEFVALHAGSQEACWFRYLMQDMGIKVGIVTINEDNQSAIRSASAIGNMRRLKHMDVKYHSVQERIEMEEINVKYIPSEDQVADGFTKLLQKAKFEKFREGLGLEGV